MVALARLPVFALQPSGFGRLPTRPEEHAMITQFWNVTLVTVLSVGVAGAGAAQTPVQSVSTTPAGAMTTFVRGSEHG